MEIGGNALNCNKGPIRPGISGHLVFIVCRLVLRSAAGIAARRLVVWTRFLPDGVKNLFLSASVTSG